jgi:3-hydroxybutyryl-CoA dehydrogenase
MERLRADAMSDFRGHTIGVVGAGAMGRGIAQLVATAGHRVVLGDANAAAVVHARDAIGRVLDTMASKGKLAPGDAAAILDRIAFLDSGTLDTSAYDDCALVIEAIVEDLDAKRALVAALGAHLGPSAMIATNTSSLSIAAIAKAYPRSARVVGMHFFNPAPVLPLVEVVPWMGTDNAVVERARSYAESWGKTVVVAADTPGFIVNRVARPFYGEALRILDEGIADCATIDAAMKTLGGFRMGPFELMDFIGNDVNYAVTRTMFESFFGEPRYRPSITQKRLVEAGRLGRKTGRGYFEYGDGQPMPAPRQDDALASRIFERILAMLINEAAEAVLYRVASARDVDLAMVKGVNYPRGLLAWSDELGAAWAFERLSALQAEYGEERYRPSPMLRRMAHNKGRFHS